MTIGKFTIVLDDDTVIVVEEGDLFDLGHNDEPFSSSQEVVDHFRPYLFAIYTAVAQKTQNPKEALAYIAHCVANHALSAPTQSEEEFLAIESVRKMAEHTIADLKREVFDHERVIGELQERLDSVVEPPDKMPRPDRLDSKTYRLESQALGGEHIMMTVSDCAYSLPDQGTKEQLRPFEVFFQTRHSGSYEFFPALGMMVTSHLRRPGPFRTFVIDDLIGTIGENGYIIPGTSIWCGGIVSHIGYVLQEHCCRLGLMPVEEQFRIHNLEGKS